MNKKWKKFGELTEKCCMYMIGVEEDFGCWLQAYEMLKDIIAEERAGQPDFALELYQLDEITDYAYDIQGWLQDCMDELDMHQEYESLLQMLDGLLDLFQWEEESPSDIRFMKSSALSSLNRNEESAEFCKKWLEAEPDNMAAISAAVYAYIKIQNMDVAGELIAQHIKEDTECNEENDILFTAASKYYQLTGNTKQKKQVDKKMKKYEKMLEEYYMGKSDDDDEFSWDDGDFPFI